MPRIIDTVSVGAPFDELAGEVLLREAHDLCDLPVAVFGPAFRMPNAPHRVFMADAIATA